MESTVEEERSTFDYDDTQGVEGSEELLEMDSFEYDEEELPLNDALDSTATIKRLKGRGGGDHIELGGFRYSYQTTLKNGSRFYRCVLRGGASLGCNARLYEDPVSGEVTLSGEHVHDANSGKSAKTSATYRGLIATCNGYRMRSSHANANGEVHWQCAKKTTLKCSATATSGTDAGNLVETRKHNHDVNAAGSPRIKTRIGARNRDKSVSCRTLQTKKVHGDDGPRRKSDVRAKADTFNRSAKDDPPPPQGERSVAWAAPDKSVVNAYHSPMVDTDTNGTSSTAVVISGSTPANNSSATVTEYSSMWNFKSREAMRNADVVLHLQDTKLYAHKAILSAISPVLDEALRQSAGQTIVHSVDPSGVGPDGLEAFLHSIYPCGSEPTEDLLPQVTILAYRYGIRALLRKCVERLKHSSTLSKLDKLMVAIQITDVELEDQVIASLTKDDIRRLLHSDLKRQVGEEGLLKLLAKCVSL